MRCGVKVLRSSSGTRRVVDRHRIQVECRRRPRQIGAVGNLDVTRPRDSDISEIECVTAGHRGVRRIDRVVVRIRVGRVPTGAGAPALVRRA